MQIKINRQYLEDISGYFIPLMLDIAKSLALSYKDSELELLHKICYSVLKDIELMFARKKLTSQKNFTIKFKEAEGIIFMRGLLSIPLPAEHVWRQNLRNQIIEQLHKQLA